MLRLVAVLLALVGCSSTVPIGPVQRVHDAGGRLAPRVVLELHADVRFTPAERDVLEQAGFAWEYFTNGFARVRITYDADLRDIERQATHDLVLRVTSDVPFVQWANDNAVAYVVRDPGNKTEARKLFVVADRIPGRRTLYHAFLHELGHMLWLSHAPPGARAVMAEDVNAFACPQRTDMARFCAFHRCDLKDVRFCE